MNCIGLCRLGLLLINSTWAFDWRKFQKTSKVALGFKGFQGLRAFSFGFRAVKGFSAYGKACIRSCKPAWRIYNYKGCRTLTVTKDHTK